MNHIKMLDNISSNKFMVKSLSSHSKYPALFSGYLNIQGSDCEEFIMKVETIFHKSREKWSGLEDMSFFYGIDPAEKKLKYIVGVSSESLTFSMYVLDSIKGYLLKLESTDECLSLNNDDSNDAESTLPYSKHRRPPGLVQITADSNTVKGWIDSFIKSRREIINAQNVREFCLPSDKRLNCARVDAVLVKRKDTSSHIRVEHVSNLWGPQTKNEFAHDQCKLSIEDHTYSISKRTCSTSEATGGPTKKKKIYSSQDVASKLEEFKLKYQQAQQPSE